MLMHLEIVMHALENVLIVSMTLLVITVNIAKMDIMEMLNYKIVDVSL